MSVLKLLIAHAKRVFFQSSGPQCIRDQIGTAMGKSILKKRIRENDPKMRTAMRKSLQKNPFVFFLWKRWPMQPVNTLIHFRKRVGW